MECTDQSNHQAGAVKKMLVAVDISVAVSGQITSFIFALAVRRGAENQGPFVFHCSHKL